MKFISAPTDTARPISAGEVIISAQLYNISDFFTKTLEFSCNTKKRAVAKNCSFTLYFFLNIRKIVLDKSADRNEQRRKHQCHDRHQLDKDVDGRAGRILERIAYGVAYYSSLVRL